MSIASTSRSEKHIATRRVVDERTRRPELRFAALAGLDVLVVILALTLTAWLADVPPESSPLRGPATNPLGIEALLLAGLSVVGLILAGSYRSAVLPGGRHGLARLAAVSLCVAWLVWIIGAMLGREPALVQIAAASLVIPLGWSAGRALMSSVLAVPERVLLLGSGVVAQRVVDVARREPRYGLEVIGCLDDEPGADSDRSGVPLLGNLRELPIVLETMRIDRVIVAFSRLADHDLSDILRSCDEQRVELDVVPRLFDVVGPQPAARSIGGVPVLGVRGASDKPAQRFVKRALDMLAAGSLLLLASPALVAIAIAVRLDGGPVLFRQIRVGQHGRLFQVAKFRTMVTDAERLDRELTEQVKNGELSIDAAVESLKNGNRHDPRVTRVGDFLRRTSLDELPQLLNVVTGQMSLVGPRPLRPFEVEALKGWQQTRQAVRPGITGLWQVLGRSEIGWNERMQLDYDYARHWSLALDFEILVKTVRVVLLRKGAT